MRTKSLTLQALDKEIVLSSHSMSEISMFPFNLFIFYLKCFFFNLKQVFNHYRRTVVYSFFLFIFSEELIEDKDLKEITFLSKDLIKLSNFCEKKDIGLKWHNFVIINLLCLIIVIMVNLNIYYNIVFWELFSNFLIILVWSK